MSANIPWLQGSLGYPGLSVSLTGVLWLEPTKFSHDVVFWGINIYWCESDGSDGWKDKKKRQLKRYKISIQSQNITNLSPGVWFGPFDTPFQRERQCEQDATLPWQKISEFHCLLISLFPCTVRFFSPSVLSFFLHFSLIVW